MAIAIYARKSSESEDRQVQSLDDQVRALQNFAERENIRVSEIIQEARSAKTPYTRPEFEKLIAKINSGEIEGVLTWAINRLSRNLVDGGIIAHLLQTSKLQFIKTPERTYKPEDNVLIMSIENGMATSFVQDLSRNVKRGLRGKCERGWYPGAAPIGYKNNFETHEIEPDPRSFGIVKHGWKMILSGGFNMMDIHRELVRMGLQGIQKRTKNQPIGRTTVYRIFTNRFYAGEFDFSGKRYVGKHIPMITKSEFEQAQSILAKNPVTRPQVHSLPFAGTLTCGNCGCAIVGDVKKKHFPGTKRTVEYVYYRCTGARGCSKQSMSEEKLFQAVETAHKKLNINPAFRNWCAESLDHSLAHDSESIVNSQHETALQLEAIRKRKRTLLSLRLDGEIDQEEFRLAKDELDQEEARLGSAQSSLSVDFASIKEFIDSKLRAAEELANPRQLTVHGIRGQMRSVGENHLLTLGKLELSLDPVIQKIAAFEPRASSSERSKPDDYFHRNPNWLRLLAEVRKIARMQFSQQNMNCIK